MERERGGEEESEKIRKGKEREGHMMGREGEKVMKFWPSLAKL